MATLLLKSVETIAQCQLPGQKPSQSPRVKLRQHFAILVFSKHRQLRPTLCDSFKHTHSDLSFLSFCLLSFIYFLYFLSFLELFAFHPLFIHYFLLPTISFFSYTSTPFIHSFIVLLLLFCRYDNNFVLFSSYLFLFLSVLTQTTRSFLQSLRAQVETDGLLPNPQLRTCSLLTSRRLTSTIVDVPQR